MSGRRRLSEVREGPIVTLDGPAGSGKSSTAKEVARRLGFRHLDSGALYRALTLALLDRGVPEEQWANMSEADLRDLGVSITPTDQGFDVRIGASSVTTELRDPEVTERVSQLASLPATRGCLLGLQRSAAGKGRLVADGRDMGTVVFPDAEVKVYLVADLEERARRRLREIGPEAPSPGALTEQVASIAERDRRDLERPISPLRMSKGAHLIDTTGLSFEEQVQAVVELVNRLTPP